MKKMFETGIEVSPKPSLSELKEYIHSDPQGCMGRLKEFIETGKIRLEDIPSMKALYQATAEQDVTVYEKNKTLDKQFAVTTSAFPVLTSLLGAQVVNDEAMNAPTISDQLVTDMDSPKKVELLAKIVTENTKGVYGAEGVPEDKDYPRMKFGEDWVMVNHRNDGRIIEVSQDTLDEMSGGALALMLRKQGKWAINTVEHLTLDAVCDRTGSKTTSPHVPYVYMPKGTGTGLYSASANTPSTRTPSGTRVANAALTNETDINEALAVLATHLDDQGNRIALDYSQLVLLAPFALEATAFYYTRSQLTPQIQNEVNIYGPGGPRQLKVLSSTYLDGMSATAWYLGNFKESFLRKWKLRYEYVTAGVTAIEYLRRRTAFQARIAFDVCTGAIQETGVVQCLSSTTYTPSDPVY